MVSDAAKASQPMFPYLKGRGGASKLFQKGTMVMEKEQGQGMDGERHSRHSCSIALWKPPWRVTWKKWGVSEVTHFLPLLERWREKLMISTTLKYPSFTSHTQFSKDRWSLNHTGLNCAGLFTCRFFSINIAQFCKSVFSSLWCFW